jgi:hypothetical protein
MKEIRLLGKKILPEKCPVLMQYTPASGEDWLKYFMPMNGKWECDGEWLIGEERKSWYAILFSRERYEKNVMFSFTVMADPPATRDLNAVLCANWDEEKGELGESYVCGLNGWYEHKSGIERNGSSNLYSTTSLYKYTPGTAVRMTFGCVDGQSFMIVDGEMITELVDPAPIRGGHIGFSAYCTRLKIKDVEVREIVFEDFVQSYEPEF